MDIWNFLFEEGIHYLSKCKKHLLNNSVLYSSNIFSSSTGKDKMWKDVQYVWQSQACAIFKLLCRGHYLQWRLKAHQVELNIDSSSCIIQLLFECVLGRGMHNVDRKSIPDWLYCRKLGLSVHIQSSVRSIMMLCGSLLTTQCGDGAYKMSCKSIKWFFI